MLSLSSLALASPAAEPVDQRASFELYKKQFQKIYSAEEVHTAGAPPTPTLAQY